MADSKNISCWVITEGLKGTENQCLGITDALNITPSVFQLQLRQPWKTLSPWLGFESPKSYWTFPSAPWPDLLVCSGRKSIAAARYIRKASQGKTMTVYVQDPRIPARQFDLVIAPEHDPINGNNVVKTTGAPNRITDDKLLNESALFPDLCTLPPKRVAVLLGGNSKTHKLSQARMQDICTQLQALDASLMITPSRRTGDDNIAMLNKALSSKDNCYIWDGDGDNPYFAMLGLADFILVTNDSASMLSEAATTGKPVYTLPLDGKGHRINALHDTLRERGIIREFSGQFDYWAYHKLNDAEKAAQEIQRVFTLRHGRSI